jgi:CBS domain-containing protein
MLVSHILREKGREVVSVSADTSLGEAAALLARHRIGAILVLKNGAVRGILSERDIVRALAVDAASALHTSVETYMTRTVSSCAETDAIEEIMEKMTCGRFRHMPVLDRGRLCGIVSIGDVVKARIAEATYEAAALKDYIVIG